MVARPASIWSTPVKSLAYGSDWGSLVKLTHIGSATWGISPSSVGEHVRHDTTWSNGIDTNMLVTHICAQASNESLDGVLAASVQRVVLWSTSSSSDGRHEDDRSLVLKVLVGLLGNEELRPSVGVEDVVVDLGSDLEKWGEVFLAGVGHDDIETPEGLLALLEESDDVGDLSDIGLDSDGVRTEALDLLDDGVGLVGGFSVVDDNLGATSCELKSNTLADTSTGTSDEGDLALER